ncbi:MAG: MMPL family transporter [Thermoleophilia bacterium]
MPPGGNVTAAVAAARATPGVAAVLAPTTGTPGTQVTVVLASDPYTLTAYAVIPRLRHAVAAAAPGSRIGGPTATEVDVRAASRRDSWRLPPAILAVVFVILAVLLRALLVPALLTAAVILSFLAALGASAVVFDIVGAPGEGPTLPLYGFVFLVALGVDYSIFLMARAARSPSGTARVRAPCAPWR